MKKSLIVMILAPILLLLIGCPVDTKYPLSDPGTEKIDQNLLGTWENNSTDSDADVKKVKISKKNAFTYDVIVVEKGSMYMADTNIFDGFVTKMEGKDFFYVRPAGNQDKYYLYCYQMDGKKLKTYDVGLKVGGLDAVTSTNAFREEVKASLKMQDCLSGELVWEKL
jgi:hypothetical protein